LLVHLRRVEGSCALLSLLDGQFLTLIITEVESVFQFLRVSTKYPALRYLVLILR